MRFTPKLLAVTALISGLTLPLAMAADQTPGNLNTPNNDAYTPPAPGAGDVTGSSTVPAKKHHRTKKASTTATTTEHHAGSAEQTEVPGTSEHPTAPNSGREDHVPGSAAPNGQ